MSMKTKSLVAGLTGLSLFSSGCGMIKNLDDMHDSTVHMDQTTTEMNNGTKDMGKDVRTTKDVSIDMKKTVEQTYAATKDVLGGSTRVMTSDRRAGNLKELRDSNDIQDRISIAGTYVDAMEYQHWAPSSQPYSIRDTRMAESMQQLFLDFGKYMKDHSKVSPTKTKDKFEILYAISFTIDHLSPDQTEKLEGTGIQPLSPLNIIESALSKQALIDAGKMRASELTPGEESVVARKEDAIYLLRVRHNFLMALAYANLTSDKDGDLKSQLSNLWSLVRSKLSSGYKWTPNFADRNQQQINDITNKFAKPALETALFLQSIGQDVMTDSTIRELLTRADFSSFDLGKIAESGQIDKAQAIGNYIAVQTQLTR